MNADMARIWNNTVGPKDTIYLVGDFAWKDHRRFINELNGKKIMIMGSHDKMPGDVLDLFVPSWEYIPIYDPTDTPEHEYLRQESERLSWVETVKTLASFREVHWLLNREICKQYMCLCHWPMRTWQGKYHNSWCLTAHTHGRMAVAQPGQIGGGLMLDVGWDVHQRPIRFEEVRALMQVKMDMMSGKPFQPGEEDNH